MVKSIYTYKEFKKAFPNVTSIKKLSKSYRYMCIYEATDAGKINKRVRPSTFDIGYDGKWFDTDEFKQFNPSSIYKYTIPSMAKWSKGKLLIVFRNSKPNRY